MQAGTISRRAVAMLLLVVLGLIPAGAAIPTEWPLSAYMEEEAFPSLPAVRPVALATPPGDTRRLFIADQRGLIHVITNLAAPTLTPFLDLRQVDYVDNPELGIQGLAFHPGFATNGTFFVFRTLRENADTNVWISDRLARFRVSATNENFSDPATEVVLINQFDEDAGHNGGDLHFGPDGYLYVGLGDEGGAGDSFWNSQKLGADFFSGILRIDVDLRPGNPAPNPHPDVRPGTYAIPPDNPFFGTTNVILSTNIVWEDRSWGYYWEPEQTRTEFWAFGLRNPWRFSFDPQTGDLWANDVGQDRVEEINRIVRGGNYGWKYWEGHLPWAWGLADAIPVIWPEFEYPHTTGLRCITANFFYRGSRYPDLDGSVLFSDLSGPVGSWRPGETNAHWLLFRPGVSTIGVHPASGDVLMADVYTGRIRRLVRRPAPPPTQPPPEAEPPEYDNEPGIGPIRPGPRPQPTWPVADTDPPPAAVTDFPEFLSETGQFSSTTNLQTSGSVQPYEVNHPFFSDHALKRRWFRLPAGGRFTFTAAGPWSAPVGSVWMKHFDLELRRGDPTTRRRLETRLLVRGSNDVATVTYRWNTNGTDATRIPLEGFTEEIPVEIGGLLTTQIWRYPGRFECLGCHNPQSGQVLGFDTPQLNRPGTDGTNQLIAWQRRGWLTGTFPNPRTLPAYSAIDDESTSIHHRVRSYLAANCAACHREGGSTWKPWDARWEAASTDTALLTTAINSMGWVTWPLVRTDSNGVPLLTLRLRQTEFDHMPPLGSFETNHAAVALLDRWFSHAVPALPTWDAWLTNQLGNPATNIAFADGDPRLADPDADGLPNELEYLLGTDPRAPSRPLDAALMPDGLRLRWTSMDPCRCPGQLGPCAGGR
jgi:glucose/arabinose dehydrogenase